MDRRLSRTPFRLSRLPRIAPGDIRAALPAPAPEQGESFDAIMADFERVLVPGLTHWNHPGFFAYFAIIGSGPAFSRSSCPRRSTSRRCCGGPRRRRRSSKQCRWLAAPSDRPARRVRRRHLRHRLDLDAARAGRRARGKVPDVRGTGWRAARICRGCASTAREHAHSSVDKAVLAARTRTRASVKIPADAEFRMRPDAAARRDRRGSRRRHPADRGRRDGRTTSSDEHRSGRAIADICEARAISGCTSTPRMAASPRSCPRIARSSTAPRARDSLVVNPHKWLFVPFDLSVLYCRRMDVLRAAFTLTPSICGRGSRPSSRI